MLGRHQRIIRGSDFTRTLRHGARVRRGDLMVHVLISPTQWPDDRSIRVDVAEPPGPRVGMIVSKSVGDSVTRHTVSRRLRVAATQALHDVDTASMVVIRAFPSAVASSSDVLAQQLSSAFRKVGLYQPVAA